MARRAARSAHLKVASRLVGSLLLEIWESFWIALRAIRVNKLRAVLTTLGIIIGITAVTSMVTVINGIDREFENSLSALGADVLYVEKWPWVQGPSSEWWVYWNRPRITAELAEPIEARSRLAAAVAPVVDSGRSVVYGGRSIPFVSIEGSTEDYERVHNISIAQGRFYNAFDNRAARRVAVIGAAVAEELFPVETPLGKVIRLGGHSLQVIGVLEKVGSGFGDSSQDTQVKIPFNTFSNLFGTGWRDASIHVRVVSVDLVPAARDELTGILRTARGLDATERDDFEINQLESLRETLAPVKLAIFGIGIFLTALSLLVGGIGVMNIMFVSVTERTREIGIRKAIGAKRRTILIQFLIESVIICLIGGSIAVLLALWISNLVNKFMPTYLPAGTIVMALFICVAIGIGFGLAPAWRAARSEPIEALHHE